MRRGIAQLEFVLVLVVLLPLFLALLWLGFAGSTYTMVISDARHQAWRERQITKSQPFEFDDAFQGRIEKERSETIDFVPMFDSWAQPKSKHVVYAGAWGHPEIDLNDGFPNYVLMGKLALKAPADRAQNIGELVGQMEDFFKIDYKSFEKLARKILDEKGIKGYVDELEKKAEWLEKQANDLSGAMEHYKQVAQKEIEEAKSKIQGITKQLTDADGLKKKVGELAISKLKLYKLTPEVLKDPKKLEELFGTTDEGKRIAKIAKELSEKELMDLKELQKLGDGIDDAMSVLRRRIDRLEGIQRELSGE